MSSRIDELTVDELQSVSGGDWYDLSWGAALIVAMAAGVLAAPALIGGAVIVGGTLAYEP